MEDDFDIYEDLDFGKKKHEDNCQEQQNNGELLGKVEKLEERVKHLEAEVTNVMSQKQILETNFSSLLKTAKNELSRKDRMIFDLRAQIDNFYFRRNKGHAQKDTNTKNNSNNLEFKKDPEPSSEYQNEKTPEKLNNLDKSLPLYLSPEPQLLSRLESLSDDEDTEVVCHSNKLVSTVFGERLKKRLEDQEEKERLQREQVKSLTSVSQNNEIAGTKIEVKTANVNNMDNKENQYRLISLDSPKKNLKRENEDKVHEVLDKRKKYSELSEASQSCKSKKRDYVENSQSCKDKFIDKNMHTSEYFCSPNNGNDPLENVNKYQKKSPEYDRKIRSSRNVDNQEDDRYTKYRDNDYRDNRSKSRSRMSSGSEKNYSCVNRGKNRGRGRYPDGRDKKNYYSREDDFSRNQSRSRIDSRNHNKQWKNNEAVYENDVNERRYSDEKIYGEVRRSRRIEARSHSHYTDYSKDSNYYNKDNYKNRRYEERNRTRRRSRSRGISRERNSADSTSSRKNDCARSDDKKKDQLELNKNLEEGEIEDDTITDKEMNILNNIFEGNEEVIPNDVLTPVFQSPREERIENIQEFIQKYDNAKVAKTANNKDVEKNTDCSTDIKIKNNEKKDGHRNKCDKSKEEKANLDEQLINIDVKNIEKVDQTENKTSQEILIEKKEQSQDPKLELLNNINLKPVSNNEDLKENKCDTNKTEIVCNEDKNNLDIKLKTTMSSTENNESRIKEKAKIEEKNDLTANRDPEYCKILLKYLKKKSEQHDSIPSETSINVSTVDEKNTPNTDKKYIEVVHSEPVENIKFKKYEKGEPQKIESDKYSKVDTSLTKSGESFSPLTPNVLTIVSKPESTVDSVDKKVKNDECFVSPIPKNTIKRTASKNEINVKNPSTSTKPKTKKVITTRKQTEKIDENQNSNKTDGVMILVTRRRPTRLSDFSSPVTVVSTASNIDNN